jgi:hypothetical protein
MTILKWTSDDRVGEEFVPDLHHGRVVLQTGNMRLWT